MATISGTAIFYTVLIAPGFIAVMTAISLAGVEQDISRFVLLVSSVVASIIIDGALLTVYHVVVTPITSAGMLTDILFTPTFRPEFILILLGSAVLTGGVGAKAIIAKLPEQGRKWLQRNSDITYNPRQPWPDFMEDAAEVVVKTTDDQLYVGTVEEWSRAGRPRQLRIGTPDIMTDDGFVPVGREDMLFFEEDIARITMWESDD